MKNLNKIAKSAVVIIFGLAFAKLIGYFFKMVVARTDINLYGLYNLSTAIIGFFIPFLMFGLELGIVRYVSYYHGKNHKEKADIVISSAFKVVLPLSILFFIAFFFFSDSIALVFNKPELGIFLKFFSFLFPILALSNIFSSILEANKKIAEVILSYKIVEGIVRLSGVLAMFYFGFRLFGLIAGLLLSSTAALLLSILLSKNLFNFKLSGFSKEIFIFSFPLFGVSIILGFFGVLDTLLLGYFTDIKEVALYSAALPTAQLLFVLSSAMLGIFLPIITERYAKNISIKEEFKFVTKWIFILSLPFVLFMILFSKQILLVLFGADYILAWVPLSILTFFFLFFNLSSPFEKDLLMRKKTKIIFWFFLATLVINLTLNLTLIPLSDRLYGHGMYGASIATGASFFLLAVFYIIFSYKNVKIKLFDINYIKILTSGFISILIVYFMSKILPITGFFRLTLILFILLALYLVFLVIFRGFDRHDQSVLREIKDKAVGIMPSY